MQFGATGFAGLLTAEYLAEHAPASLRWALAGRNLRKLEDVRDRLAKVAPDRPAPELIEVALTDQAALDELAAKTKVLVTSVGPYAIHGQPLVAAAAKAGCDYVDITGEPQFVDDMYLKYHDEALETGARLVHCAGFDSVPHDLGALFTVRQLPHDFPIAVTGAVRANAEFSGGTFQSAIGGFAAMGEAQKLAKRRRERELAEHPSPKRRVRPVAGKPRRDESTGRWLAPLPTIDPAIVVRSAAALPEYGPDFTYEHTMSAKRLATVAGLGIGAGALLVAVKIPPVRNLLKKVKAAGTGPDEARREQSWFTVRFTGKAAGKTVITEVRGGDPGYDETAKMLAESALCLAFDDNPETAGQVTTAVAMGDHLLERLQAAGISFTVVSPAN
ncbi:MAG: saccharopine dehydrogenase NADP-binding domain-containing protein [Solirubrobacteraceae bacterium]|nr:saccharopine dehydrogenase NADP-binding domain-containing protein [Solirubrobacteraceae bacterium]